MAPVTPVSPLTNNEPVCDALPVWYELPLSIISPIITDEVAAATDEIATAIDEATGDEVTPEVAEAAAEIAVAIVEEKVEEVAMNKQLKELTEVLNTVFLPVFYHVWRFFDH